MSRASGGTCSIIGWLSCVLWCLEMLRLFMSMPRHVADAFAFELTMASAATSRETGVAAVVHLEYLM